MLDGEDEIKSYVLEVPDELLNLTEGIPMSLPKNTLMPFVWDNSKLVGVT